MAREHNLWTWFREGLKGQPGLHVKRVENAVSQGDPDLQGCWCGTYFEVELKGLDRPSRPETELDVGLRTAQVSYLETRVACGGNAWVYVRVGRDRTTRRYLVKARHVRLLEAGLTEEALALLADLPGVHRPLTALTHMVTREGGETVTRNSDDGAARASRRPGDVDTLLVGISYSPGARQVLEVTRKGDPLTLRREPSNTHDQNAVAVWAGPTRLGYLRRLEAALLAPRIDAGEQLVAVVASCPEGAFQVPLRVRKLEDPNWDFLD